MAKNYTIIITLTRILLSCLEKRTSLISVGFGSNYFASWEWLLWYRRAGGSEKSKEKSLDSDNVWALLNDRFNVMATYSEEVIGPIVKAEYIKADKQAQTLKEGKKIISCG